jgi:hypothetical protein
VLTSANTGNEIWEMLKGVVWRNRKASGMEQE